MDIRRAAPADVPAILEIFRIAKAYMAAHGNAGQWGGDYPGLPELLPGHCPGPQLCPDRRRRHRRHIFIYHRRRTYLPGAAERSLARGPPYGTIHRLASSGTVRGVSRACFDFCLGIMDYVRIDTHENNHTMQSAITGYGFRKCGNIYASNGTLRTAYDFIRP